MAAKKKTKKKSRTKKKTTRSSSASASGKQLVIVESPAKAKTINRYLGSDFVVKASVGHVRDLPTRAPKGSKQPVPGVDLEQDFEPTYEVLSDKKKVVTELRKMAKDAAGIWFATDLDREGEAIAWHLANVLDVDPSEAKRVVFNAITRTEIEKAFSHPNPIDEFKVNAQQARRILDRIVGYQASPLLWKKVARGLSAGRVQSVAVRLIVEREREIAAFIPEEHWKVTGRMTLEASQAEALEAAWSTFAGHHRSTRRARGRRSRRRTPGWQRAPRGARPSSSSSDGREVRAALHRRRTCADTISEGVARRSPRPIGLTSIATWSREDESGRQRAGRAR